MTFFYLKNSKIKNLSWLISCTDTVFSWNQVMLLGSKNSLLLFGLHPHFPCPIEVMCAIQYVWCTGKCVCFLPPIWLNKMLNEATVADLMLYNHMWLCYLVTMTGMLLQYEQKGILVCGNLKDFAVIVRKSYTKGVLVELKKNSKMPYSLFA